MKKSLLLTALCALFLTSCSQKIIGTWNVDRYEVNNQKGQNITTRNAGEIVLNKDGSGEKNIEYNIFNNEFSDVQKFDWKLMDSNLTITGNERKSKDEKKSDFDKTWIVITNKKDKQLWKSTDGSNAVQIIELSRKK
ncbi:hypothetical protein SAMN04487764_2333 [Gillisia sp. Hel1_33_143]|uniref:hypothetical protein n=1 Tax=unclassified Gillisia TaxID=2615025 RepID=UPI0005531BBA|nr:MULTISPECIES: hypothetical protein [unclassified Gillisia]SDS48916.1 hypothetical protein SAMN04487764_2333 [Gillisia sp. Hel1_33_143]